MVNENEDYMVDGLLYCGKCHTAKQIEVKGLGRVYKTYCLCKCEAEKREAEEKKIEQELRLLRIARLREAGFFDATLKTWTFAKDDMANQKISEIVRRYVEHFCEMKSKGKGLLLYGPVDTGKTFMSACIANALIDKGYPCLVTNFPRLINIISDIKNKQDYIDGLNQYDLLVIDDLASERDTEYMSEIVMNVIDTRYRSGKPLIVTTNLTATELKNTQEIRKQRIYSRLMEMCFPVEVKSINRRKEKLKQDFEEMKDILGL